MQFGQAGEGGTQIRARIRSLGTWSSERFQPTVRSEGRDRMRASPADQHEDRGHHRQERQHVLRHSGHCVRGQEPTGGLLQQPRGGMTGSNATEVVEGCYLWLAQGDEDPAREQRFSGTRGARLVLGRVGEK